MNQPRPFNSLTTEEKWDRIRAYRAQDITYTDDMKDFMVGKVEPKPAAVQRVAPGAPKKTTFPWRAFDRALEKDVIEDGDVGTVLVWITENAPNVNPTNAYGETPLEIALDKGNSEVAERFVDELKKASGSEGGRRRLGLYVKRRGTKRHGRSRKHRKLRKLTSRRR